MDKLEAYLVDGGGTVVTCEIVSSHSVILPHRMSDVVKVQKTLDNDFVVVYAELINDGQCVVSRRMPAPVKLLVGDTMHITFSCDVILPDRD